MQVDMMLNSIYSNSEQLRETKSDYDNTESRFLLEIHSESACDKWHVTGHFLKQTSHHFTIYTFPTQTILDFLGCFRKCNICQ